MICFPEVYLNGISKLRISQVIPKDKFNQINSETYLGCSIQVFKQHIETQFKSDMTWQNYGKLWEIDHKIPLKYNNPTLEEVIQRLHYTNTQPLYKTENRSKGNRFIN